MKYWFTRFSSAVLLSVSASAATLLAGILILRILDPDAAGEFTLVTSVAGMAGMVGLFGQNAIISRLYSRSQTPYNWPRDLTITVAYGSIIIGLLLVAIRYYHSFTWMELVFVGGSAWLTVLIYAAAFMLNSHRHYVSSTLLLRLPNALFIIPVSLAMLGLVHMDVPFFLFSQILIGLVCAAAGLAGLFKFLPMGSNTIPWGMRKESFGFFLLMVIQLLIDPGLIVMAGYFVRPGELAAFAGYMNLIRPFLLIWSILIQTLAVEYARDHTFPRKKLLLGMWGLAIPLFFISWAVLPFLLDLLYSGKYNMIGPAALPISLLGALLLTETVPRSYIAGCADDRTLQKYIRDQVILTLISLVMEISLIMKLGVTGAAWGGCIMLFARNLIAYTYLFRMTHQPIISA